MKAHAYSAAAEPCQRAPLDTASTSLLDTPRHWLRLAIAHFGRHRRRNQAIRELRHLADWQLENLGIERSQIGTVVDGLLSRERPSRGTGVRRDFHRFGATPKTVWRF